MYLLMGNERQQAAVQWVAASSEESLFDISYFTWECFIPFFSLFLHIYVYSVLFLPVSFCIVYLWGASFI